MRAKRQRPSIDACEKSAQTVAKAEKPGRRVAYGCALHCCLAVMRSAREAEQFFKWPGAAPRPNRPHARATSPQSHKSPSGQLRRSCAVPATFMTPLAPNSTKLETRVPYSRNLVPTSRMPHVFCFRPRKAAGPPPGAGVLRGRGGGRFRSSARKLAPQIALGCAERSSPVGHDLRHNQSTQFSPAALSAL
jgi:hypothetical protein